QSSFQKSFFPSSVIRHPSWGYAQSAESPEPEIQALSSKLLAISSMGKQRAEGRKKKAESKAQI
ncbi:MAG: hypothetical protein ACE10H_14135, partial [Candidatus Binatia bacterium]